MRVPWSMLLRTASSALLALALAACGGGGSQGTGSTSAAIGAAGGTLVSADGLFTLTIPAGALATETTITVTELPVDAVPPHLRALNADVVYRLEPAGTTFALAPTVTLRLPGSAPGTLSVMLLESGGVLEAPADLSYSDTPQGRTLSGRIPHFSHLARWTVGGFTALLEGVAERVGVGQPVTATFTLVKDGLTRGSGILHGLSDFVVNAPVVQEQVEEAEGSTRGFSTGLYGMYRATMHGRCQSAGKGSVDYNGYMTDIFVDAWGPLGPTDVRYRITLKAEVECVADGEQGAATPIALGLFPAPAGLSGLDELRIFRGPFANLPGNGPFATLAGAQGFKIIDLVTRQTVLDRITGSTDGADLGAPLIGVLPVASAATAQAPAMLLGYGNGGTGSQMWVPPDGFGLTLLDFLPVFDVSTVGGGTVADTVIATYATRGVDFLVYNAQDKVFRVDPARRMFLSAFPFAGQLMSAQKPNPAGPGVLVLSRSVSGSSTLSSVYFKRDDDAQPATRVLFSEGDGRRMRCKTVGTRDICAMTMFGGLVKLFVFDSASPTAQLAPITVQVAPGALGVDIATRTNGNLVFAVANFTSNSYNVIETTPDLATVVSNTLVPAPTGCTNPAHPAFVSDSQGLKVVVTCNGSANYFAAMASPP